MKGVTRMADQDEQFAWGTMAPLIDIHADPDRREVVIRIEASDIPPPNVIGIRLTQAGASHLILDLREALERVSNP